MTDKSRMNHMQMQDGRIAEAVAWQISPAQRHTVLDHMLQYALARHLGPRFCSLQGCAALLDAAMLAPRFAAEEQAIALRQAPPICAYACSCAYVYK